MLSPAHRAQSFRARQTGAEARLWRALRGRRLARWKFRRQYPIEGYITDFCCMEGRLVVEVDGATHSTDVEGTRDAIRTRALERCGYHVLRVTNAEVYGNLEGVLETILAELEHRTTL